MIWVKLANKTSRNFAQMHATLLPRAMPFFWTRGGVLPKRSARGCAVHVWETTRGMRLQPSDSPIEVEMPWPKQLLRLLVRKGRNITWQGDMSTSCLLSSCVFPVLLLGVQDWLNSGPIICLVIVVPSTGWIFFYLCFTPSTAAHVHTGRSSQPPCSKPPRKFNRAIVVL